MTAYGYQLITVEIKYENNNIHTHILTCRFSTFYKYEEKLLLTTALYAQGINDTNRPEMHTAEPF